MPKPGRRIHTPSEEMAHFTDREDQQQLFQRYLFSAVETPVLVFYGVGGAGKTWLLKKLLGQVPSDLPTAFLDFDRTDGRRFVVDPVAALYSIRQQLAKPTPRFDLAYGVLRFKQGASEEKSILTDLAGELLPKLTTEIVGYAVPGTATLFKLLSKPLVAKLEKTPLLEFIKKKAGQEYLLELKAKTAQEIGKELIYYLADDLRESLPTHLNRAVTAVLFFDTFEAVSSEAQNEEHKRQYEQWIRDVASNFEFALTVIAGQNQLTWDEINPRWKDSLDQHLVGGLSDTDARRFLTACGIDFKDLQDAILATAKEEDGGHHCFSLGLCADIVDLETSQGKTTSPESLRFAPQDWENLARRFLKSLATAAEARWIERLALTPQFDEAAARKAFSNESSAAQDAAWETLLNYSFVERSQSESTNLSVRLQMRWALENQPSAKDRVRRNHVWWQHYWASRSIFPVDQDASLSWYHRYCTEPDGALDTWSRLAKAARTSIPPRMSEHFNLLRWWDPVGLLDSPKKFEERVDVLALFDVALELQTASLGIFGLNLQRAIRYYEATIPVCTEKEFPAAWATIQNNLGVIWRDMPTGDGVQNMQRAIEYHEAALRVCTEKELPIEWASTQNHLGVAWRKAQTGDKGENLQRAIEHHEAALRIYTEKNFPEDWASTQNNLGNAWANVLTGEKGQHLQHAIKYYEAALRVYTEKHFPQEWATIHNNLGATWRNAPPDDSEKNLQRAIECCETALRVYTEREFPQKWADIQINLGVAWADVLIGDREKSLLRAIECYEAALRVYTEKEFPQKWAGIQFNLGYAWRNVLTGNNELSLQRSVEHYEAAQRVFAVENLPQNHLFASRNLDSVRKQLDDVRDTSTR